MTATQYAIIVATLPRLTVDELEQLAAHARRMAEERRLEAAAATPPAERWDR